MPPKPEGVYRDAKGRWYFKVTVGRDPLTGTRTQVTRRGFRTAAEASAARIEVAQKVEAGLVKPTSPGTTVNELLDLYLDGLDADQHLSAKTRFDYRTYADHYVLPLLGAGKVRDLTPEMVLGWQRALSVKGGTKNGKPLAANTIRLARSPLSGALKLAIAKGIIAVNPVSSVARPSKSRAIPKHWTPEEARHFLDLMNGDRHYPVVAFLLGSGVRIGELVWLRWANVDVARRTVHIVDFASALGHELRPSRGKSRDAVRSIDLDDGLIEVLRTQRALQLQESLISDDYEPSDFVFTKPGGGSYHPQHLSRQIGRFSEECQLPRLTAHGLRHTSATLMLASGVAPKVAAERLGHADPTLFTNLYSHVTPTMQREAADKIGSVLFSPPPLVAEKFDAEQD